jgi:flavin-binding protein dodecin
MDKTYKKIEIVGTSAQSFSSAVQNAIATATRTLQALSWFEVTELRGSIVDGKIAQYQATVKLGFRVLE